MNNKKLKNATEVYECLVRVALFNHPLEDIRPHFDDSFMGYGSAEDEVLHGWEGYKWMVERQREELGDESFKINIIPIVKNIDLDNGSAYFVEEFEFVSVNEGDEQRFSLRLSSLLSFKSGRWIVSHFHGSFPDVNTPEGQAWPIEEWKRRNAELQAAVDEKTAELQARNRDLQIEASLERVRGRAMAMNSSEELADLVTLVFKELTSLDMELTRCLIWIFNEDLSAQWWMANAEDPSQAVSFYIANHSLAPYQGFLKAWKENQKIWEYHLEGKDKKEWDQHLFNKTELVRLPIYVQEAMQAPQKVILTASFNNFGALQSAGLEPLSVDNQEILKRFGQVFDQTYTRFLDLKKAEAQAREGKIEAALERLRSRTMAMHQSHELGDVVSVMYDEMDQLGLAKWGCALMICHQESESFEFWLAEETDSNLKSNYFVSGNEHPFYRKLWEYWEQQGLPVTFHHKDEYKREIDEYWLTQTDFKRLPDEVKASVYERTEVYINYASMRHGLINAISYSPLSEESKKLLDRFAKVFEQTYTRFLDLKKAEAQAREAQIVASLERVRAASMAMHHSDQLSDVLTTLFEQFDVLNINPSHAVLTLIDQEKNTMKFRMTGKHGYRIMADQEVDLKIMDAWVDTSEKWKKSEPNAVNVNEYPPDTLPAIWELYDDLINAIPEESRMKIEDFPNGLFITEGYCRFGYIGFAHNRKPTEEEKEIVVRFASEFGSLYQRFLDLQKAEDQAREAQIEAALERVRSRSMAMQDSSELSDVATVLFKELSNLGGNLWSCGFVILKQGDEQEGVFRMTNPNGEVEPPIYMPNDFEPSTHRAYLKWLEGAKYYEEVLEGKSIEDHYRRMIDLPKSGKVFQQVLDSGIEFPDWQQNHSAYFNHGYLIVITLEPYEDHELLERFASTFEQVYTRFLDLERAEAQAREAQIEAALERVRAASMAMHKTNELGRVVEVLFQQFSELDLDFYQVWINIFKLDEGISNCWFSPVEGVISEAYTAVIPLGPFEDTSIKSWRSGEAFSYLSWNGLEEVDKIMKKLSEMSEECRFAEIQAKKRMDRLEIVDCNHQYGVMAMAKNDDITDNDRAILSRFTKVFEQAYTRFLDLQKAEAQAREAKIEAALEMVRSRTMAMQSSDELPEAANLLFEKVKALGIPTWSAGYNILSEDNQSATCWMSSEGTIQEPFTLTYDGDASLVEQHKFLQGEEMFLVQDVSGDALKEHYEFMMTIPKIKELTAHMMQLGISFPTHQINHLCKFEHGYLLFITYEAVPEAHDIFIRFTKVFEQTYTRFLDLQVKEEQSIKLREERDRLEKTLSDLRAAQKQLIHAEKMASLGELTAGIAHEIQNPLNFVNNFSEVSSEMIEEANEEIDNGELEEAKEILDDLKGNLEKINHHGQRASGIVRSMLDHSRTSSGEKVSTDINALCDEYLRLAYHGMRAKDRSFNAAMETNFDESLPKIMVIPQDIGRVLLNLINNAFQAVQEKSLTGLQALSGKVSLSTKNHGDKIEITVTDNGSGIPDDIKDKIFQPFFTTKPTGQGTGLGLSLSYDIIKAHGGTIDLKSEIGKGTTFTIKLPIVSITD